MSRGFRVSGFRLVGSAMYVWALGFVQAPTSLAQAPPEIEWWAGGHNRGVYVAYSPDGQMLATSGDDYTVKLWQSSDGRLLRTLFIPDYGPEGIAFSPDGQLLAVALGGDGVELRRVADGEVILWIPAPRVADFNAVVFEPGGQFLITGHRDGTVRYWRVADGLLVRTVEDRDRVLSVAISRDGRMLAAGLSDGGVSLWRVYDGERITTLEGHTDQVRRLAFSPDGRTLASRANDGTARLWRLADGELLHTLVSGPTFNSALAFSPDGNWVATAGDGSSISVWRASNGSLEASIEASGGRVLSLTFSPKSGALTSSHYEQIITWHPAAWKPVRTFLSHSSSLVGFSYWPDGQTIATCEEQGTAKIWRASDGLPLRTIFTGAHCCVGASELSPDGRILAVGHDYGVELWDPASGKRLRTIATRRIRSMAFSPDGQTLAWTDVNNKTSFWSVPDGELLRTVHSGDHYIACPMLFTPDGQTLIDGGGHDDQVINFWRVSDGEKIGRIVSPGAPLNSLALSPDGAILAAGDYDGVIRIWKVSNRKRLKALRVHTDAVQSLAFSPDGRTMLSAGGIGDRTIRLWRVSDWSLLQTYDREAGSVSSIRFSPDGRTFGYSREDGTVVVAANPFQGETECGRRANLSTRCKNGGARVIARLKGAKAGAALTFTLDSRQAIDQIANERGKAKVTYTRQEAVSHTVRVCALESPC